MIVFYHAHKVILLMQCSIIEPGWGAGLWIPLREESRNIFLMTSPPLKSFLSEKCYEALYRFVVKAVWTRRREEVLHDRERA
jgi:hypothetical protein